MNEIYRIDEAMRVIWVYSYEPDNSESDRDGIYKAQMPFSDLERYSSAEIVEGCPGFCFITRRRRELYAIARDDLIERGTIEDRFSRGNVL
jgi:hypothetical protein